MEQNIFEQSEKNLIYAKPFDFVDKLMHQMREDRSKPIVDVTTGEVKYALVPMYDNPSIEVRLLRTKKTQEDLIILAPSYRDTESRFYLKRDGKDAIYSRAVATEADIKRLWPEYSEDMTREQVFALKPVIADEARCILGFYHEVDKDGNPVCDLDGNPIIRSSVKWQSLTFGDKTFELTGDKRRFERAEPAADTDTAEPASEQASEEGEN